MSQQITDVLQIGKCYFQLAYYDQNLTMPFVEPYFFLGKNIFSELDCDDLFFQGAAQFLEGKVPQNLEGCEHAGVVIIAAESALDFVVDWQGLIDELVENKSCQDQGKFFSQRGSAA